MRPEDRAYVTRLQMRAATLYGVTVDDVQGASRRMDFAHARQAIMYVLRHCRGWSLSAVGEAVARHTSTVHIGAERASRRMRVAPDFAEVVRELEAVAVPSPVAVAWIHEQISSLDVAIADAARARSALMRRLELIEREEAMYLVGPPGADGLRPRSDVDPLAASAASTGGDTSSAPVVADCGGPTALSAPWGSDRVGVHDDQDTRTEVLTRD